MALISIKKDWQAKEDKFNFPEVEEINCISKEDLQKIDESVIMWPFVFV